MPMVAQRLPLPRELWDEGVRRYGFHGLSYQSIVRGLGAEGTRGRTIVAHLGNGASLAGRCSSGAPIVSADGSCVLVRVIAAQKNPMVARHTYATPFETSTVEASDRCRQ